MSTELAALLTLPALQASSQLAKLLYLIPILLWFGAAMWVLWDSVQRAGEWGLLWGVLAFGAAPIVVPIYLVAIVIADRPAPAWVQREKELATAEVKRFKAMGEMERVKFLEAASGGGGTLYQPGGLHPHDRGVKQFSDAHAELLLERQQHAEAFIYLYDMHELAVASSDLRGEETYRFYITQLPDGLGLLKRARDKNISPAQLKAGGIKLLDAWTQPPDRSRPDSPVVSASSADDTPPSGQTLEQLLNAQEPPMPAGPAQRPLEVKTARDPRAPRRPEVPF